MDLSKINISSYLPTMPYVVRELFDKATNIVMNYSETEAKVVEATNDESWGPPGKLLQDLSQLSYTSENYNEIMGMLWKRCFTQDKRYWRRTYKSLLVLTYLIKNGNEKVITSIREHLFDLKSLETFAYYDENNKDQGINIRHKVKELVEFVQNDDRIRDERKRAKANRDKYVGMSNEASPYRYKDRDDDNEASNSSKTKDLSRDLSDEDNQNFQTTSSNSSKFSKKPVAVTQAPIVDLLGDEVDYTSNNQTSQDIEFGQFQEAISPTSPVQPSLWPTSTQSLPSDVFDPFASFEPSTNIFPSNEFNSFTYQTQPIVPSANQPKPNSFTNTWSSAQGKLDISLNNLIPHTRGDSQKNSLPINQLTSPTNSAYNTQSVFSNLNRK